MFLRALLILHGCLLYALCSMAQTPTVIGIDIPYPSKNEKIHKYVGKIGDNHFLIRRGKKQSTVFLEKYDRNFVLQSRNEILQGKDGKAYKILWDVYIVKEKLYAIYTQIQKAGEGFNVTRLVEIAELSQEASVGKKSTLATLPNTSVIGYGDYHFTFSADSSNFLLSWMTKEKDAPAKVSMLLFDLSFSKLLEKEISLSKQTLQLTDIRSDNNKTIYIATRERITKEDNTNGPWYKNEFYVFKDGKAKAIDFKLGNAFMSDMKFIVTKEGIRGAGLLSNNYEQYSPINRRNNDLMINNEYLTQGMLHFWIDNGQDLPTMQKNNWDKALMSEINYEGNKNGMTGVPYLRIRNLMQTPDQDLVAVAELSLTYIGASAGSSDRVGYLECGPIFIDRASKSKSGNSLTTISKWQKTSEFYHANNANEFHNKTVNYVALEGSLLDLYFGNYSFLNGEDVCVIYNDHVKNIHNSGKVTTYPGKGNQHTILATIKPDGKLRKDVLLSPGDKTTKATAIPMFKNNIGMIGREVLLYGNNLGKTSGFIRVKF
jgi:hypothetical protein